MNCPLALATLRWEANRKAEKLSVAEHRAAAAEEQVGFLADGHC